MARNKLSDLNDHLFAQIERLSDEELTQEELKREIERGKAISLVSKNIIENAKTVILATNTRDKLLDNDQREDLKLLK